MSYDLKIPFKTKTKQKRTVNGLQSLDHVATEMGTGQESSRTLGLVITICHISSSLEAEREVSDSFLPFLSRMS